MRFRVDDAFWELFPAARIGVVVVRGIDNTRSGPGAGALLQEAAGEAARVAGEGELGEHPAVRPWREAYRAFGVKPSKYRSGIESLLRSARGGTVRSVNPLVDLYNAVSLGFSLPCGGEDLAAVRGNIRLTRAAGGEAFVPLGAAEAQPPEPGEVIYRDDEGVLCRCWNWREAERTKLTAATTDAFLCLEALPPITRDHLGGASERLAALVRDHLGGAARVALVVRGGEAVSLDG